jgi:DNA-binding transcriptional MerR regulator
MESEMLSIGELADAAGLSRRAVRFYVQQKLLDPPAGVGRGRHYGREHLNQLKRIATLQSSGHSLEEIRQIFDGQSVEPATARRRIKPLVSTELWTRLSIADGIELNFDARRFSPSAEDLSELRDEIRRVFDGAQESILQNKPNEIDNDRREKEL